ncbi:MAG: hypothetical protein KKE02_24710 [Alphaproteobacteria bacterium]|nr:hypothetical protein [Alphaproteobacteria bacterium]MBU1513932.1 hypothetical protein [Alphaproteobacteria bacterium]MBU2092636.1 hypothetical protein [Alphaproteobacteria bacterium]MBU2154243.1 hypothetical protein [Alphaproteobacteria bacterium]MBU2309511.1 hypothetical protein [Alphaproteobacteria bacterium]
MSSADIVLAMAAVFLGAPVLLSLVMLVRSPRWSGPRAGWDLGLSAASTLAYALAFNLIFFVQELFLVVPKALTPGLKPTLFHNNHDWTGDNPLAELFQGTGALATVVVGLAFAVWVTRRPPRSRALRLFATWMALLGLLEALPQVLIGSVIPQNDVGRAMTYLGLQPGAKIAASVAAMLAMALACGVIAPLLLTLVPGAEAQGPRGRARTVFRFAVLPALAAVALIVPFRVPGAPIEILFPPVVATLVAVTWLQAWSWVAPRAPADPPRAGWSVPVLLVALGLLLAVFQVVLRPGIAFY